MNRTPMPPRAAPMSRGSGFRSSPSSPGTATITPSAQRTAGKAATETGFTTVQRLAVRTRAGNGDPEQAACECCGRWLGRYGGQVHHRQNRQSGGSRLRNRLSNALLACGTPFELCHGKCTIGVGAVKEEMEAAGFVLESGQDPLSEPVMLHGQDGGVLVYLDDDAHYRDAQGNILSAPAPGAAS